MHLGNFVFNRLHKFRWTLVSAWSTFWMLLLLRLTGINFGSGARFYGLAKFLRASSASVTIGRRCTFRSLGTSNLIGINRPCIFSALEKNSSIAIGDDCGFSGTVIGSFSRIRLGNKVRCGANTLITDSDWHLDDPRASSPKPIEILDNVWLGVNVVVLKGVTIGENSIIGANSVVTKSIPANVVAGGNPCKVIRPLSTNH